MPSFWTMLAAFFRIALLSTPQDTLWAAGLVWLARVVTLALLFRTYIVPNIIRILSDRLRIRSISLRSVRGLYLKTGRAVFTAERVKLGWRWVPQEKIVRFRITVESLGVELLPTPSRKKMTRSISKLHARMPTLADLSPSPITPSISTLFTYVIRPALTAAARGLVRVVALTLPTLTQVLEIELDNTSISSRQHEGATLTFATAELSSKVAFSQFGEPCTGSTSPLDTLSSIRSGGNLASFWRFISTSSNETAWASTRVTARVSFSVNNIACFVKVIEDVSQSHIRMCLVRLHACVLSTDCIAQSQI
jgi:hypothetical protein